MNKKIIWGIIAVVILVGLYFSFNKKDEVASNQTIKLGMMFPLTSEFGAVAEGVKNASLLAVEDWQIIHPNTKIETFIEDDGYDAKKGLSAYNKLKSIDNVDAIFSVSTPVLDALYKIYQKDGLPVINIGTQTQGVGKDNIFQIFPDTKGQIKPLADYLQNKTNYDSVVIIHPTNDTFYSESYNEFIKIYTKPSKEVVLNSKDDSKIVATKVMSMKPQAIVILVSPAFGSVVTRDIKMLDKTGIDYFYEASLITGWTEYEKMLGDTNKLNGATTIKTISSDMTKFKAEYKAKYGVDPSIFAESGYDSTMIMLNSYNKNKTIWVNNIQNSSYVGVSGKTTFDERGIRIPEYEIVKIVNGELQ